MKYLKISNKGKIDVEAFTLLGASTKRDDPTKIGMFGSGNKYAIAYLLRNNYEVTAFSGLTRILFSTEKRTFRDMEFDVLLVNSRETSITAQLGGVNWKLWQAVRELYSNAIDEGLIEFGLVDSLEHYNDDETAIFITATAEIEDMMLNIDEYFLHDRQPIYECEYGAIYSKTGTKARIYRKGIKCFDTMGTSLFDYDLYRIVINESRMVQYTWQPAEHIWNILYSCDKPEVIRKVLIEIKQHGLIEREINQTYITPDATLMSGAWIDVLKYRQIYTEDFSGWLNDEEKLKTNFVPNRLYGILTARFGNQIQPRGIRVSETGYPYLDVTLSDTRAVQLAEVLDFIRDIGFQMDYKIKVVDFMNRDILGSIDKENNLVLIDILAIDRGFDECLNTIIEEYIHLKHGVADCTRGFQNAVITEFVKYMRETHNQIAMSWTKN